MTTKTKVFVLLHGSYSECNIVSVFSSEELATKFRETTKVSASAICYPFELDPVIPKPYTEGLEPWSTEIRLLDGTFIETKALGSLGRVFDEEQIGSWLPLTIYGTSIKMTVWARDLDHAKSQAMALRTLNIPNKKMMPCSTCGKPTNRFECDAAKDYEAKHADCKSVVGHSEVSRRVVSVIEIEPAKVEAGVGSEVAEHADAVVGDEVVPFTVATAKVITEEVVL
jgi:hypothetical protein